MLLGVLETDFFVFWLVWKLDGLSFLLVTQFNMLTESFYNCKSMQTVETIVCLPLVFG